MSADTLPPERELTFWNSLNYPTALVIGFFVGVFGAFGGGFDLFRGAAVWLAVSGAFLAVEVVFRGLASAVGALRERRSGGGLFTTLLLGAGGGAVAGAVLTKTIDGRVQNEGIIILAVVGAIAACIVHAIRRRLRR